MQDFLNLNDDHRMNIPGTAEGNWGWRLAKPLTKALSDKINKSLVKYNRA